MRAVLASSKQEADYLRREFAKANRSISWFGILAMATMAMIFFPWWKVLPMAFILAFLVHLLFVYRIKKLPPEKDSLFSIRMDAGQHLMGLTITILSFLFFPTFAKSSVPKWFTILFLVGAFGFIYRDYTIRQRTLPPS